MLKRSVPVIISEVGMQCVDVDDDGEHRTCDDDRNSWFSTTISTSTICRRTITDISRITVVCIIIIIWGWIGRFEEYAGKTRQHEVAAGRRHDHRRLRPFATAVQRRRRRRVGAGRVATRAAWGRLQWQQRRRRRRRWRRQWRGGGGRYIGAAAAAAASSCSTTSAATSAVRFPNHADSRPITTRLASLICNQRRTKVGPYSLVDQLTSSKIECLRNKYSALIKKMLLSEMWIYN